MRIYYLIPQKLTNSKLGAIEDELDEGLEVFGLRLLTVQTRVKKDLAASSPTMQKIITYERFFGELAPDTRLLAIGFENEEEAICRKK